MSLAPPGPDMAEIHLKVLPLHNRDHDAAYPPVATAFKEGLLCMPAT